MNPTFIAVLLLLLLAAPLRAAETRLAPGDYRFEMRYGGQQRDYLMHVPPAASATASPLPLMLVFHGGGGNAENIKWYTRMDAAADRYGYVAVYPNGSAGWAGRFMTWNAGGCCGVAAATGADDAGYAIAVLDDVARRIAVDAGRVYATGLSNGAMMAYRLAAERPERIAAVAGVAGAMTLPTFGPGMPVPLLHIHSRTDQLALYDGGLGLGFPSANTQALHASVDAMLAQWRARNGCADRERPLRKLAPQTGPDTGHTAVLRGWQECRGGAEILLWELAGPGHVWPGGQRDYLPQLLGVSTGVIDANGEIWTFVSRFRR